MTTRGGADSKLRGPLRERTQKENSRPRGISATRRLARQLARLYARLFSVPELAGFHYLSMKLALKGLGVLNYYDPVVNGEDYFVSRLLPGLIQNDAPVFFDVGANRGDYAQMLMRVFPRGRVYAFEPHPANYRLLVKRRIRNVYPGRMALGEAAGEKRLYDYAAEDGSQDASLYKGVFTAIRNKETVSHAVKIQTLDAMARKAQIDQIDLLKIDTEGGELAVLRGATAFLLQGRIGIIQFEFNEMNAVSKAMLCDFRQLLNGYSLFRLLPRGILPVPQSPVFSEIFAYQNIVAVPADRVGLLAAAKRSRRR